MTVAGPLGHESAVVDDAHPVAEALGLFHVVGGVEHREAVTPEHLDGLQDLVAALGIDTDRGFVEDQQRRAVQQAGGDVGTPLHPARVGVDAFVGPLGAARPPRGRRRCGVERPPDNPLEATEEAEVLHGR